MSGPDFEQYIIREGQLFVRQPRVSMVPGKGITTEIVEREADPYDWRNFEDRQSGRLPSPEPPQELAQNE
jgi:protein involved in sex pheromone biosynthesis